MYPPFWENFENSIPLSEGMCLCVGEGGGGGPAMKSIIKIPGKVQFALLINLSKKLITSDKIKN